MDIIQMQHIKLGDEETIRQYYDTTLKLVQQLSVKQLLKEWIKEIEPKKQKNFPYKRGIRPKWWPDDAAYKEPDHIKVEGKSDSKNSWPWQRLMADRSHSRGIRYHSTCTRSQ
jgi:hypothetical protein